MRIERVGLKYHRDVALARLELVDAPPADRDLTRGDGLEASDHAQQCRFPASRCADQHDEFAVGDIEIDIAHDDDRVEPLADAANVDSRHRVTSYFTAPSVKPRTMKRWPSAIRITAGIVDTIDAAAIWLCWISYCCAKRAIATGTVARSRDVRLSATGNSFQLKMNARMPDAIRPGMTSGSVTRRNASSGRQPSTSAASSISGGNSRKNARISHTVIGKLIVTCVRINAMRVS